jgi:hypothetical protein
MGIISVSIPGIYPASYQPKISLEPPISGPAGIFLKHPIYQDSAWYEFSLLIFFFKNT